MTTYSIQDLNKIKSAIEKSVKHIGFLNIKADGDFYLTITTKAPKTAQAIMKIVEHIADKNLFKYDLELKSDLGGFLICGSIYKTKMHQAFDKFADAKLKAEKEEVKVLAKIEGVAEPVKLKKSTKNIKISLNATEMIANGIGELIEVDANELGIPAWVEEINNKPLNGPMVKKSKKVVTPVIVKSEPKTAKLKKETGADISRTKPGVKDFIFAILHCQVGITRANILKSLIERFPERSADSMQNTVKALLSTGPRCRLAKERNATIVFIERDSEVYFRVQTETEEAPKTKTTKNKK